jgi:hypothetical protein
MILKIYGLISDIRNQDIHTYFQECIFTENPITFKEVEDIIHRVHGDLAHVNSVMILKENYTP